MAEPRGMVSMNKQPIGWPTHKYQHCLKTVMPSRSRGTNMKLHRNIPRELLPTNMYSTQSRRWRTRLLPPVAHNQWTVVEDNGPEAGREGHTKPTHHDIRPPSAYSDSIILKPATANTTWTRHQNLDLERLKGLMRENTFRPGNFSTLYQCPRDKVANMVNRLSYDPYERREQLILTDNMEGDTAMYSKEDIDAIVQRLATSKPAPEVEQEQEKLINKELSAKEKEIVDRLSKVEPAAEKPVESVEKKTITEAQVEEMLKRLTQKHERKLPSVQKKESKKVSVEDMEGILNRLTTYDSQKWPPESKPEIFRQHLKEE